MLYMVVKEPKHQWRTAFVHQLLFIEASSANSAIRQASQDQRFQTDEPKYWKKAYAVTVQDNSYHSL